MQFDIDMTRGKDTAASDAYLTMLAEDYFHAQGVLNVVENVSVSVREPTIQNQAIYERQDNFTSTSVDTANATYN
jgi:hypothetical protein